MTDDQLREACARALGWEYDETLPDQYGRWKRPFDDPRVPIATAWIPMAEPPPLDGNTAVALLMHPGYTDDSYVTLDTGEQYVGWCTPSQQEWDGMGSLPLTTRNIILAALLALGEISAEDLNE